MIVGRMTCLIWLGAAIFSCVASAAGGRVGELQARFDHETNAVHRAKLLEKLGDAQFDETRRAFKANDLVTVGVVLEKYRDNVRVAFEGLKKKRADAERDANGYRQLEIHVRRGIREVEEILLRIPEQFQPPLEIVRGDLDAIDRELIHMLFHHRDGQAGPSASAPSPAEAKP
jgi:hypothetical protein